MTLSTVMEVSSPLPRVLVPYSETIYSLKGKEREASVQITATKGIRKDIDFHCGIDKTILT